MGRVRVRAESGKEQEMRWVWGKEEGKIERGKGKGKWGRERRREMWSGKAKGKEWARRCEANWEGKRENGKMRRPFPGVFPVYPWKWMPPHIPDSSCGWDCAQRPPSPRAK